MNGINALRFSASTCCLRFTASFPPSQFLYRDAQEPMLVYGHCR